MNEDGIDRSFFTVIFVAYFRYREVFQIEEDHHQLKLLTRYKKDFLKGRFQNFSFGKAL